jgi:hypothetical protein
MLKHISPAIYGFHVLHFTFYEIINPVTQDMALSKQPENISRNYKFCITIISVSKMGPGMKIIPSPIIVFFLFIPIRVIRD